MMTNFEKFMNEHSDKQGSSIRRYICGTTCCDKCPLLTINCHNNNEVIKWANAEAVTTEEFILIRYKVYTCTGEQIVINSAKVEFNCDNFYNRKTIIFKDKYDRELAQFNYSNICGFVRF